MNRQKTILAAKFVTVLAVPALLWAFSSGPDAHHTAVPGTGETSCNDSNCHVGTALNGGGGNIQLTSSAGTSYTPGQKQTLTLKITDAAAKKYGFQATARLGSDSTKPAGTFSVSSATAQAVLCASGALTDVGVFRPTAGCSSSKPLEFIEHIVPSASNTITFDWTPPSTDVGAITIYVSANAANGDTTERGDHIYTTSLTLTSGASASKPTISAGGIINAAQFGAKAGVAPGTWVEIYGSNFTNTAAQEWAGGDFTGVTAPTSLGGVQVTVAGKPAFIRFISPGQVNAQIPDGIGTGPVQVIVINNGVSSDPLTITASATLPGLLAPFNSDGKNYVAAFNGSTIVGSPGLAAVKPGDTVTLYGIGWGATKPTVPAGNINNVSTALTGKLVLRLSQIDVSTIPYQGLGPGFVGLYQINIVVPATAPDGDLQVDATIDGTSTGQTLYLTVKK